MSIVSSALQNSASMLGSMNAASSMGVANINAPTLSTDSARKLLMGEYERAQINDVIFDARTIVRKADNGYILQINNKVKIASSAEEVRDLILAEMVSLKLEQ